MAISAIDSSSYTMSNVVTHGLLGIVLVLAITALCIFPFELQFFLDWVTTAFMAGTPTQIVLGLLWGNSKPTFINKYSPPIKGVILTLITICSAIVVLQGILFFVGGGFGITPMLAQYTIVTIVVTLWIILVWQCWPLNRISAEPKIFGLLTLITVYPLAYLLWSLFFDYSILQVIGFPNYHSDIDPRGMFDMWQAITFAVTTTGVVIVHILFDFWPINKLCGSAVQPLRGVLSSLYVLGISWILYSVFVTGLGMEQVDFMVRIPVCMIFATFLLNNMMQGSLFHNISQPFRGLVLMICCILLAVLMHELYTYASALHAGYDLSTGSEGGYAREIWIASAMLGVTFPIIFLVSGFFNFWPIKRKN